MCGPRRESASHTAVAKGEGRGRHGGEEEGESQELALNWPGLVSFSRMASPYTQRGTQSMLRWLHAAC